LATAQVVGIANSGGDQASTSRAWSPPTILWRLTWFALAAAALFLSLAMAGHRSSWSSWYGLQRWRNRSTLQLREHPLCKLCLDRGRVTRARIADHIIPHKGDWNAFVTGALQSLCHDCHNSTKRTQETRGYSPEIGPDGWPVDPRHPAYRQ
jgi:hypothetical protein